jgi:GH18 family chitinase/chitodextrinase
MNRVNKWLGLSLITAIALAASPTKEELASHKKIVGYFPEWGVYSGHNNYAPSDTPFDKLTHMNYAFARILNGEIAIFDNWAATGITFNESWDSPYKGTLGQFKKLKSSYPNTSFLISVGGWTQSAGFHDVAATQEAREKFALSCVAFVRRWHFDGIDIDWEFPTFERQPDLIDNSNDTGTPKADASEKSTFTLLLKALRQALDTAGSEDGRYYQLTSAVGASKKMIEGTEPEQYAQYLDFINVMTYDMHGAWDSKTNHQAPIVANPTISDPEEQLSLSDAVRMLRAHGVDANKIVVGSPFYSRGWKGVQNNGPIPELPGLGATATGGAKGIWDGGVAAGVNPYYHIKSQMEKDTSFTKYRDPISKMPYLYSESKGEMYTYDDEISVAAKSDYVNDNDLGGVIFWEVTADFPIKGATLTTVIHNAFFPNGHPEYVNENSTNPEPQTNTSPTEETTPPSQTTPIDETNTPDPITPIPTTTVSTWDSNTIYTKPNQVIYNNHLYEAQWWNRGETPGSTQWGAWKKLGLIEVNSDETETTTTNTQESNSTSSTSPTEVKVEQEESPIIPTTDNSWNKTKIYTQGQHVSYNNITYQAQWWTQGEIPGSLQWGAWRVITNAPSQEVSTPEEIVQEEPKQEETSTTQESVSSDGATTWQVGTIYFGGETTIYNNHLFKAKWWTRGETPIIGQWSVWQDLGPIDETLTNTENTSNTTEVETTDNSTETTTTTTLNEADLSHSMFAPFVDTTAWPPYDFKANSQESGNLNYALGFLVAKSSERCEASWGTYYELDNSELDMVTKIATIQNSAGRVLLSFGGAANTPLAAACQSITTLTAEYQRVIDTLHIKEIDFDIEGAFSRDTLSIERRSAAIAQLQSDNPELKVWFTLAVLPSGLTEAAGMTILRSAINAGVKISGVNIMAMDYGDHAAPNPSGQMGKYAIDAATSLHTQLKTLYPSSDDASLWKMVGITPMIGMNDVTTEIFDQEAAKEVLAFANEKSIGLISLWSANRDKQCGSGTANYVSISCSSLLQNRNEFSTLFSAYGAE